MKSAPLWGLRRPNRHVIRHLELWSSRKRSRRSARARTTPRPKYLEMPARLIPVESAVSAVNAALNRRMRPTLATQGLRMRAPSQPVERPLHDVLARRHDQVARMHVRVTAPRHGSSALSAGSPRNLRHDHSALRVALRPKSRQHACRSRGARGHLRPHDRGQQLLVACVEAHPSAPSSFVQRLLHQPRNQRRLKPRRKPNQNADLGAAKWDLKAQALLAIDDLRTKAGKLT